MQDSNIIPPLVMLRNELGLTQGEFAEYIGMSQAWVSRVEAGELRMSGSIAAKIIDIAALSGITIEYMTLRKPRGDRNGRTAKSII